MILEVVDIRIHVGQNAAFVHDLGRGVNDVISKAKGFVSYKLHHGIESPERYLLHIFWNTLEDHTVGFRQSEAFGQWRSIVGPYFAEPPKVEHFNLL